MDANLELELLNVNVGILGHVDSGCRIIRVAVLPYLKI